LIFLSSVGVTLYKVKNPAFLNEQARETNLYGRLSANLPRLLPESFAAETGLSTEDLADVLVAAVDAQTFYGFVDAVTSSYITWLVGDSEKLDFRYDLEAVKTNGRDKALDRLLAKYGELPLCDSEQVKSWSTENGLPSCRLPEGNVRSNDVSRLLGQHLDKVLETLPSEIVGNETAKLREGRAKVLWTLQAVRLTWIITAVFLLLYLVIFRRAAFLSLAFVFLLAGVVEAAFSLIAWDWVGKIVIDSLPSSVGPYVPLAVDLITAILDVLKRTLSVLSFWLIAVGALFLLLWIFYRPKPRHPTVVNLAK
jgi:hypothetical protein